MAATAVLFPIVGLLPVLCFLGALFALESFRIVSLRLVVAVLACGALAAVAAYFANDLGMKISGMDLTRYSRCVSPTVEEALKGAIVVALLRRHRIGFLVDASILGFAAGAGFALIENLYIYLLHLIPPTGLAAWTVRGFGTAIMHGGSTAIFAVLSLRLIVRRPGSFSSALLPGFAVAVAIHTLFNFGARAPRQMTMLLLLVLPPLFCAIFTFSERSMRDWFGRGFDADAETLELLNSGRLADSPTGRHLDTLLERFSGPVVADVLCYLRLYTELGMRAKGILIMRENGISPPVDETVREKYAEMKHLERSIGRMGLLAIRPMLRISPQDLMQIYRLDS